MPAELSSSTPPPKISIADSALDSSRDRLLAYDVPGAPARRSGFVLVGLVGFVVALALTAVIAISKFPLGDSWTQSAIDRTLELASSSEQLGSPRAMRSEPGIPRLIVQASRGIAGEPAPLGLSLQGQAEGAVVIIRGLVSGMELSTGASIGGDAWQLSATDLHYAWIAPPKDFEGSADLIAELRLSSNQIADRRAIHLEWMAPISPAPAPRELDRDRIPQLQHDRQKITALPPLSADLAQPPLDREEVSISPPVSPKRAQRQVNRKEIRIIKRGKADFGIARGDVKDANRHAPFTDAHAGDSTNALRGFWDWSR
jgi:hypothetical protein